MQPLEWEGKTYIPEEITGNHPLVERLIWNGKENVQPHFVLRGTHGAKYLLVPWTCKSDNSVCLRVKNPGHRSTPFSGAAFTIGDDGNLKYTCRVQQRFRNMRMIKTNAR